VSLTNSVISRVSLVSGMMIPPIDALMLEHYHSHGVSGKLNRWGQTRIRPPEQLRTFICVLLFRV
jgi:hypothetical protein